MFCVCVLFELVVFEFAVLLCFVVGVVHLSLKVIFPFLLALACCCGCCYVLLLRWIYFSLVFALAVCWMFGCWVCWLFGCLCRWCLVGGISWWFGCMMWLLFFVGCLDVLVLGLVGYTLFGVVGGVLVLVVLFVLFSVG